MIIEYNRDQTKWLLTKGASPFLRLWPCESESQSQSQFSFRIYKAHGTLKPQNNHGRKHDNILQVHCHE